jgi:predicted nucleic acid-binding protein
VTAFVVDPSALVHALIDDSAKGEALRARLRAATCHAPHLIDAEVGNSLRGQVLRGELPVTVAEVGLRQLPNVIHHRYGHTGLLAELAWQLQGSISYYDALYASLAGLLDVPLLTADARLSRAPGLLCRVEVVD